MMEQWKNCERRQAVTAELEAHLTEVLQEAGQLTLVATDKIKIARELLDRLCRHQGRNCCQEEELPF